MQIRASNDICDSKNCKVSQCEKRHPKEFFGLKIFVDISFINVLTNMSRKEHQKVTLMIF